MAKRPSSHLARSWRFSGSWGLAKSASEALTDSFGIPTVAGRPYHFIRGAHQWSGTPDDTMSDVRADHDGQVLACGNAGSLLVFNESTWHRHTANASSGQRRSRQGAFIPREGCAATDFAARMQPETRARLGPVARHVLAL